MDPESPERRRELQRRLDILKDHLEKGKLKIAAPIADEMIRSLRAVKLAPDGIVDLSTVDSRVRTMALAITALQDRADLKDSISLAQVQSTYFGLLDANFGQMFAQMQRQGLNPHTAGVAASRDSDFVAHVTHVIPEFMELLVQFWNDVGEAAHIHVEDVAAVKAVYGGDFFPSAYQNIASTCGVYLDTIVLPDPLLRSHRMFPHWSPERQTHYFVKHALNVLQYRDLALADVSPPIVAVLPDRVLLDEQELKVMDHVAKADVVLHASAVFDREFKTYDEVLDFLDSLKDPEQLVRTIARPDRVLFDVDWSGSIPEQLERVKAEQPETTKIASTSGRMIALQAYGRMAQSNDLLTRSQRLGGTPLIDAPTSWRYFQWKLEYDSLRLPDHTLPDLHIVRALQAAGAAGKVRWIGRVPPEALIALRREQLMPELRHVMGEGIEALAKANPQDFGGTADAVVANIQAAFAEYEQKLDELTSGKLKFAFKDVGSWLVIGSVEVTAAATGMPLYGLASIAGNQLLDVPKLWELPGRLKTLIDRGKELKKSPVGMLFKYIDD